MPYFFVVNFIFIQILQDWKQDMSLLIYGYLIIADLPIIIWLVFKNKRNPKIKHDYKTIVKPLDLKIDPTLNDERIIEATRISVKIRQRYNWIVFPIFIILVCIDVKLSISSNYSNIYFILGIIFGLNYIPNLITLYFIKCPFCFKRYFTPRLCSSKKLNEIFHGKNACINCNQKAIVISGENNDLLI
jgi:F0F1-type ATP synthase assembly protein I